MKDLFIVSRNERALYDYLARHFEGRRDVEVILDRRVGGAPVAPLAERRRLQTVDRELSALGFSIVAVSERGCAAE